MKEYRELLEEAARIEAKSQRLQSLNYIDVEDTGGYAFIKKARSYSEMLAIATRISSKFDLRVSGRGATEPMATRPQVQQRAQQLPPIIPTVAPLSPSSYETAQSASKGELEHRLKVEMPLEQPKVEVAQPTQQTNRTAELALKEIGELVKVAGVEPKKQEAEIKFETPKRDLVLPSLSVNDQISDLEGIIESLKNNRFDKYQMEIVADELHGLDRIVGSGKASVPSDQLQSDLVGLRNRRLSEALAILPKE